jgi:hypothetical protein
MVPLSFTELHVFIRGQESSRTFSCFTFQSCRLQVNISENEQQTTHHLT